MKKDMLAVLFLVIILVMIIPGCRNRVLDTSYVAAQAVPSILTSFDPIRLYYISGAVLMVAGAIVFAFGGKGKGLTLGAAGAGIAWFGQSLHLRPWLSLVVMGIMGIVVVAYAIKEYQLRKGAAVLAVSVEKAKHGQEVKDNIRLQGEDAVKHVRSLVDPEKGRLKAEGKL